MNPAVRIAFSSYIYEVRTKAYERVFRRGVFCLSNSGRPTGSLRYSDKKRQYCFVVEESEVKIIDVNDPLI